MQKNESMWQCDNETIRQWGNKQWNSKAIQQWDDETMNRWGNERMIQ